MKTLLYSSLHAGKFPSADFFSKLILQKKKDPEYNQSVKQFGSKSGSKLFARIISSRVKGLTLKAPITTADDDKFCDTFLNF